jgi:hypothetical protein
MTANTEGYMQMSDILGAADEGWALLGSRHRSPKSLGMVIGRGAALHHSFECP